MLRRDSCEALDAAGVEQSAHLSDGDVVEGGHEVKAEILKAETLKRRGRVWARRLSDGLRRDATATFRRIRRTGTADFEYVSHEILFVLGIREEGRQPVRLRFPRWWADCRAVPPGGIR